MARAKYATGKPDANHRVVLDFMMTCGGFESCNQKGLGRPRIYMAYLQGYRICAMDTSGLGGRFLDWIVSVEQEQAWLEVKTPEAYASKDQGLQPGERWTIDNLPIRSYVVMSDSDVARVFGRLLECHEQRLK